MSRVGKKPVPLAQGVSAQLNGQQIEVKGPKGSLTRSLPPDVTIEIDSDEIRVKRPSDASKHRAYHGLARNLIANMVQGVTAGFSKTLEINGVGYRAQVQGRMLELNLGFSNPVKFPLREGIDAQVEKNILTIKGMDKEIVGQVAADIRALRPPEPYKGKGIKYVGEKIIRKAGKATK